MSILLLSFMVHIKEAHTTRRAIKLILQAKALTKVLSNECVETEMFMNMDLNVTAFKTC